MKPSFWFCAAAAIFVAAGAVTQAQVPAKIVGESVNARSRPSVLRGEVIVRLSRDQQVTVFEEGLPASSPKDPVTEWTRIELPAGTPVWVSSDHVAMPAGTVKPRQLNVRAGPSEDFGVLGTVSEGTALKVLGQQQGWLKVEAPLGLSAFVASRFLDVSEQDPTTTAPTLPPVTSSSASTATSPASTASQENPAPPVPPPAPPATETVPATRPAAIPPIPTETAPITTDAAPAPAPTEPEQPETAAPSSAAVPPPPELSGAPRIVRREGIVRGTFSIQAPTPFELVAADNGKRLDYLLPQSSNVLIRPYRGQRVFVMGEEYLEPRWHNAPVLMVQQIRLAP